MTNPDAQLFLIGDSNAIAIGTVARADGRIFSGGPIGIGLDLEQPFFLIENGDFILTGANTAPIRNEFRNLLRHPGPILSTIGFNSLRFARRLQKITKTQGAVSWREVMSQQVFQQIVFDVRREALAFYQLLAEHKREVYFLHSPQRGPAEYLPTLRDIETLLIPLIRTTGANLIDIRNQITDINGPLPEFGQKGDISHGNIHFGALALARMEILRCSMPQV